jgi:hypothetical protein
MHFPMMADFFKIGEQNFLLILDCSSGGFQGIRNGLWGFFEDCKRFFWVSGVILGLAVVLQSE